jgi:hypothetical protein
MNFAYGLLFFSDQNGGTTGAVFGQQGMFTPQEQQIPPGMSTVRVYLPF